MKLRVILSVCLALALAAGALYLNTNSDRPGGHSQTVTKKKPGGSGNIDPGAIRNLNLNP